MRNFLKINTVLVLIALCSCSGVKENTDTRFLLDTFVTLSADCDAKGIALAFEKAAEYEKMLSRTVETSDVSRINRADGAVEVSEETARLVERALFFGNLSGGRFDITLSQVNALWDFSEHIVPDRSEIAEALKNVDYQSVKIQGNQVDAAGKEIDLGGIAKGYIADKTADILQENGAENGIVNMGSSIVVFGREQTVKIKKPFSENEISAELLIKDKALSTSGTYERAFVKDGVLYHHILDPKTGFGVKSDLSSATVICDDAADADALSTVCILLGLDASRELIEKMPNTQAVFVSEDGSVSFTSGLHEKNGKIVLK